MNSSMSIVPVQQVAIAIRGEYLDLPGLSLTCEQVQRLYSIDVLMSEAILAALVDMKFLARTATGRYVRTGRADGANNHPPRLRRHAA